MLQRKKLLYGGGATLMIVAVLATALLATGVIGRSSPAKAAAPPKLSVGTSSVVSGLVAKQVNMADVAAVDLTKGNLRTKTFYGPGALTGRSPQQWAKLKTADKTKRAPVADKSIGSGFAAPKAAATPQTPNAGAGFKGLDDTCTVAATGGIGLAPGDLGVATSSGLVVEVTNVCMAVFSQTGVLQPGFPKSLQSFFSVPAPTPGGCAAGFNNHPFLSDPRTFWDPNDQRFWAAALQVEGAFGVSPACTEVSRYWVAVSATADPRGAWHVYSFNMLGSAVGPDPTAAADFTMFGFSPDAFFFSGNMFNQAGSAFRSAKECGTGKARAEAGLSLHIACFDGANGGGVLFDTLQPVMNEVPGYGPRGEIFVNTFNINGDIFGDDCFFFFCHWAVTWVFSNFGPWGNDPACPGGGCAHTAPFGTGSYLTNIRDYAIPNPANEPGCGLFCVDTNDTRIASTPVYAHGRVYAAINTFLFNPNDATFDNGILWTVFRVEMNEQFAGCTFVGDICPTFRAAGQEMGWYFFYNGGDIAAYYPALMPDAEGNLCMIYGRSSTVEFRTTVYTCRRATFQASLFRDPGRILKAGSVTPGFGRWGDYFASSYDGLISSAPPLPADHPAFCGQYTVHIGGADDWSTWCVRINFQLKYG